MYSRRKVAGLSLRVPPCYVYTIGCVIIMLNSDATVLDVLILTCLGWGETGVVCLGQGVYNMCCVRQDALLGIEDGSSMAIYE